MRQLNRTGAAVILACSLAGCGAIRGAADGQGGQTAPPPTTPVQKATAAPSNPDAAILADFNARLDAYVRLRRAAAKDSLTLKETANPAEITAAQEVLAATIRNLRKDAMQGDIFSPQVAALFKRLMSPELKGAEGREAKQALLEEDGETAQVNLKVNATWPASEPLSTVPANILASLPPLPMDVEYRITGRRHLVLRDVGANIIVDFIYNAIR
jgi:hypothetical protein